VEIAVFFAVILFTVLFSAFTVELVAGSGSSWPWALQVLVSIVPFAALVFELLFSLGLIAMAVEERSPAVAFLAGLVSVALVLTIAYVVLRLLDVLGAGVWLAAGGGVALAIAIIAVIVWEMESWSRGI